jgi:hypothetical protein
MSFFCSEKTSCNLLSGMYYQPLDVRSIGDAMVRLVFDKCKSKVQIIYRKDFVSNIITQRYELSSTQETTDIYLVKKKM